MSEYFQSRKPTLNRSRKPFPLSFLFKGKKEEEVQLLPLSSLGSGITQPIESSVISYFDPYSPCIPSVDQRQRRVSMMAPSRRPKEESRPLGRRPISTWIQQSHFEQSPPVSPPPLSPTDSLATRASWRSMKRCSTYKPAASITSSEEEDDDDDEPISQLSTRLNNNINLLSDEEEEGDDELIPIACLHDAPLLSAAEKYKAKVKAKLHLDTDF